MKTIRKLKKTIGKLKKTRENQKKRKPPPLLRGGENPLTTGVKQAVPYRTGREASRYLSVSTE